MDEQDRVPYPLIIFCPFQSRSKFFLTVSCIAPYSPESKNQRLFSGLAYKVLNISYHFLPFLPAPLLMSWNNTLQLSPSALYFSHTGLPAVSEYTKHDSTSDPLQPLFYVEHSSARFPQSLQPHLCQVFVHKSIY